MTNERDEIEPRACIMLRLEEIEALLVGLERSPYRSSNSLTILKLLHMRNKLIANARETVPALREE